MNSNEIYAVIERIAATPSKKAKEAMIRLCAENDPQFRRVLRAALDPFVTYGIAKMPEVRPDGDDATFDERTWDFLNRLASRELTGHAARNELIEELAGLTLESADLLNRIITKDLRAGFTESTVNKAIPGLIPTFDCMLAHPFDAKRVEEWPVIVEPKLDGVRVLSFVDLVARTVKFYSRSGREFTTFEHLVLPILYSFDGWPAGAKGERFMLDGEVVSGSFNKTVSEVRRKSIQATDALYVVFDMMPRINFDSPDKNDVCLVPGLEVRRDWLLKLFPQATPLDLARGTVGHHVAVSPAYEAQTPEQIYVLYDQWHNELGLEGTMVKAKRGLYRKTRDYGWMKLKAEESVDVPIIGAEPGQGKYAGSLGALVVDYKGVHVRVSGMPDALRAQMWDAHCADMAAMPGVEPILHGRLAEILYHEETQDGSLRHPRFKRFRDDKPLSA